MEKQNFFKNNDSHEYYQYGFKSALESNCAPSALPNYLDGIYDNLSESTKLTEEGLENLKLTLERQLKQGNKDKIQLDNKILLLSNQIGKNETEIEEYEFDKMRLKNAEEKANQKSHAIPFMIGLVFTVFLTFYLFLFYSSIGYSTVYGVVENSDSFFHTDIFTLAKSRGGSAFGLVVLFPVIFFSVGFVLHLFLEKYKENKLSQQKGDNKWVFLILIGTFIADAIMGYKITKELYIQDYNNGLVDEVWEPGMIYSSIDFFLILILGFVIYVIWGFLLNYVLSHPYLNRSSSLGAGLFGKTTFLKDEVVLLLQKIEPLEKQNQAMTKSISDKTIMLSKIKAGKIPNEINTSLLYAVVDKFMNGYTTYIKNTKEGSSSLELILNEIAAIKEKWLASKTEYSSI